MENSSLGPVTRKADLTIEDLPAELVVYDRQRNRMHCLNRSTSFIWRLCDGHTTVEQIATRLPQVDLPADLDIVRRALKALEQAHLLVGKPQFAESGLPTRRQLAHRLGLAAGSAAALLPAIASATAPTPATAKSGDQDKSKDKDKDKSGDKNNKPKKNGQDD
jgi:Coenzyme PQQ synthesis protein D (PqqD)